MKKIIISTSLFVFSTLLVRAQALPDVSEVTGAVVDESSISNVIYVRQDNGDDANGGKSESDALLTIGQAMDAALADLKSGVPTKILIHEGTYREEIGAVDFGIGAGKTSLLVIEGAAGEEVIFSGSDVFDSTAAPQNNGVYTYDWPNDWGNVWAPWKGATQLAYRQEMVFIDGQALRQKILERYSKTGNRYDVYEGYSSPDTVLEEGTYGVAELTENGDKLLVLPPADVDMTNAQVEVAMRQQFATFSEKEGLVLRNITVQHFANRLRTTWVFQYPIEFTPGSRDVMLENCTFQWNNQAGAHFGKITRFTARNCIFQYNGGRGYGTRGLVNSLFEDNVTKFNNWRNFWGEATTWFLGGFKHHTDHYQVMRRHLSIGNLSAGCWWDVNNQHQDISELTSVLNHGSGFFYEISEGPVLLRKSLIALNAQGGDDSNLKNVTGLESTYQNNIIYGNIPYADTIERSRRGNFLVNMYPRGHGTNQGIKAGQVSSAKMNLSGNVIMGGEDDGFTWYFSENPTGGFTKEDYQGTNNYFYHASGESTGHFRAGNWDHAPIRDYEGYISWVGDSLEVNPQFVDPQFRDPANLDFRLKDTSPLKSEECNYLATGISSELLQECQAFWDWVGFDGTAPTGVNPGGPTAACNTASGADQITTVSIPEAVSPGTSVSIGVDYRASGERDVWVMLQPDQGSDFTPLRVVKQSVRAGSTRLTIDLPIPSDLPIAQDAYRVQVFITTRDGNWTNRLDHQGRKDIDAVASNARTGGADQAIGAALSAPALRSYPNPASERLTVPGSNAYRVEVYDLSGRPVLRHEHLGGKQTLDVSHLRPGVYVVRMDDGLHPERQQRLVIE